MDKKNFTMEEAIAHQMDDSREGRVYLGVFVEEGRYGRRGRVVNIDIQCPEGKEWLKAQRIPFTKWEIQAERWISVLVDNGGSIITTENHLKIVEPFKLNNNWNVHYFGKNS